MSFDAPAGTAPVTIGTIARAAGVSVATVSKVVNGRVDVSPSTRERVEAVIQEHGYRPRRGTSTTGSGLLELVFHELDSPWALEIIASVERAAGQRRMAVVLSELGGSHRPRQRWLDDVLQRRPRGVILVQSELSAEQRSQLESRSIPFVLVDTAGERVPGVPTVGSTNWDGGLAATRHLIELGHRRIAVISGPADVLCSRARIDGYRSALEEAQIELDPELVRYGDFYVGGGYEHGRSLLERPDRPTAIFAGSDYQALGVLRAARELGLHVPGDLSVVGYDNLPVTEWMAPTLTTVDQPLAEMAATATRMVLDLANGEPPTGLRIDLATELVVRESTAPPRA
jgi:LacI family transcriptional regulator